MAQLEFTQIHLKLEHEINSLSKSTLLIYREAIKSDAQQVIVDFKTDIDGWVVQLSEHSIPCSSLEGLLNSKREYMKLEKLKAIGISSIDLEEIKDEILRIIAKTILSSFFNSLFRNQSYISNFNWKMEDETSYF